MSAILFLMRYPLERWDNLKTKFDGQMAAAERLGHDAYCIGWQQNGMWLVGKQDRVLLRRCPLATMPAYAKTMLYIDLMAAVKQALSLKKFDLVYIRYMPFFANAPKVLRMLKSQGAKLVLEHPTYPFANGMTTSLLRKPVFTYNNRVFARMEPQLDLYTLIGDPGGDSLHGIPAMNIVNGVDVERFPLHTLREQEDIGLLALASMSHWQGYDRLIEALAAYRGNEHIVIHLVGGEGDGSLGEWKRLAQERGVSANVVFHGELFGDELNAVVARCDIGVGGLGLYRKRQFQSMTLKLREYMARGLPFVYAVDDPSIPENARYCLRLSNDDAPVDMEHIAVFARRMKADIQAPAEMRAYAAEHLSWDGVLRSVLEKVGIA